MNTVDDDDYKDVPNDTFLDWAKAKNVELGIPQYRGVKRNKTSLYKAEVRYDRDRSYKVVDEVCWAKAQDEWFSRWKTIFHDCSIELDAPIVPSSSPGFPFNKFGYYKKEELMVQPWFQKIWIDSIDYSVREWNGNTRDCPLHKTTIKVELLHLKELDDNKQRSFQPAPFHLLRHQQLFFHQQNERMKGLYKGVGYGATFCRGGFQEIIIDYITEGDDVIAYVYDEGDVRGYDRGAALMHLVYRLRRECLDIPEALREALEWTIWNTVNAFMLLSNGDVVFAWEGNRSGQGSTTPDNCLMHDLVLTYMKYRAQVEWKDFRIRYVVYGDDNFRRRTMQGSLSQYVWMNSIYAEFGWELKEDSYNVSEAVVGHKFLGATVVRMVFSWGVIHLPAYDSDRIWAAMMVSTEQLDTEALVGKTYSLMLLAWNDKVLFNTLSEFLKDLIHSNSNLPVSQSFLHYGIPSRKDVIHRFWVGMESESASIFSFFMEAREGWAGKPTFQRPELIFREGF